MRSFLARLAALIPVLASCVVAAAEPERTGGPYVPTPQVVVDAMLEIAGVGSRDFVIDLGSGDGRIVLTAASRYSARGLGVDIDPELVKSSNAEARKRGLAERVTFREQDVLKAKIDDATVVTLYLLPGMMRELQSKFAKELKPGTRIVSHDFPFGEWKPDREVSVDVPEKYGTPGQWKSTVYYWVVPARVNGEWMLDAPGVIAQPVTLNFEQQYQFVRGAFSDEGRRIAVSGGKLEAERITFKLMLPGGSYEFRGAVDGDRMRGEAVQGARSVPWSARRLPLSSAAAR
jgi:16S rRNA G966 N2-methylase RsmD